MILYKLYTNFSNIIKQTAQKPGKSVKGNILNMSTIILTLITQNIYIHIGIVDQNRQKTTFNLKSQWHLLQSFTFQQLTVRQAEF